MQLDLGLSLDNSRIRRQDLAWNDASAVAAFLADELVCRIAIHDDPFPYIVAQSYRYRDGVFLLHCSRFGKMAGLLRANPHVTIEIDRLVALLKAPKGQNTSFEYYSVLARCRAEVFADVEDVRAHQYSVLDKYRPEGNFIPIDDFAPTQIIGLPCTVVEMSAKKRILADGQYSPPGQPKAPYIRFPLPSSASISSLPEGAFNPKQFG
jgi:nitroimidazol reductase NimA-like FMN-containing flavoprotein (pyridoxamine 5'-phosphate oxidase superfamily)